MLFQNICPYVPHDWARRHQRQALIRTTKAYATAFTGYLPVVAGVPPIALYILRRIHRYRISRRLPTSIGDVIIGPEDYEDPDGRDNVRKLVEEGMVEAWQRRWNLS